MNFFDIYLAPKRFFIQLKTKPQWVIPLILVVISSIIVAMVALATYSPEERLAQLRERNLTPEQLERAEKVISGPMVWISAIVAAVIFTPILLLITSVIINFLIPLLGSNSNFLITFGCITSAALVRIPSMFVKVILMLIKGTPFVHTSFVLFFPMLSKESFLFRLLSRIDFFTIWEIVLIALGLQTVYELKDKRSYYLIFGIWLLYIIIISLFPGRAQ
ncbi:MAG: YIP1 family protein [candidate division WOR-3 bacterium]|nr:YIP1 family protein [candidate division WOR-3 bacterium]